MGNKKTLYPMDLVQASKNGVRIYCGEKLSTPEELSYLEWARKEMACQPEFIVKDETGAVTEIWYGQENSFILI